VIARQVTPKLEEIETGLRDHDNRIARLEGIQEGKRQAVAEANLKTG
jgi:hypothetical protein